MLNDAANKFFSFAFVTTAILFGTSAHARSLFPKANHVLKSTIVVDLDNHSVTLPIYKATFDGKTYWHTLTDVSDEALEQKLGLNFAPKLANSGRGCPSCVQVLDIPKDLTQAETTELTGAVDFSPMRMLEPGPSGFPLALAQPGARARGR